MSDFGIKLYWKHKKFLQKQENIDFLFSNDKNYRKGVPTPEIYYLAVDKRNQMHIDERHMVSEYMLIYFIHKYVSDNQIDLESMWKEINGLQTKVEYIAVTYKEYFYHCCITSYFLVFLGFSGFVSLCKFLLSGITLFILA